MMDGGGVWDGDDYGDDVGDGHDGWLVMTNDGDESWWFVIHDL